MPVTPAMSAADVGLFFGDGERAFSFHAAYVYSNDNGKGWWYYALRANAFSDIVVSGDEIPAALPSGCVHVSLLSAWMPSEDVALAVSDVMRAKLADFKGKLTSFPWADRFCGTGIFDENIAMEEYAVVELKKETPLYQTCTELVKSPLLEMQLPTRTTNSLKPGSTPPSTRGLGVPSWPGRPRKQRRHHCPRCS